MWKKFIKYDSNMICKLALRPKYSLASKSLFLSYGE